MLRINPLTSYVVAMARDQIQNKTKQNCDLKILKYRSYTIFHPVLHEITRNANPECNFYALPDRHK